MEKNLHTGNLGMMIVDENGIVLRASPEFCRHFSLVESELVGARIHYIIENTFKKSPQKDPKKPVISGVIKGTPCLIRIHKEGRNFIYSALVKTGEVDPHEIDSFLKAAEKPKIMKKMNKSNRYSFDDIIGESSLMIQIKELAARIATSNSTVLLTGESGTGKELFAQAIHGLSLRGNHPFVAVNCAAIPNELFESEVFGYEAGAFSGAKKEGKPGKIELAQNGTLFLDEISELTYHAQGKLLRVLQEREVERLGGTISKNVDIRIIAATNRDLKSLVQEGKFRQDLFYRLFVFELKIPSLRQRREDIIPIALHLIKYFNEKFNREVVYIAPDLQEWLITNDWPGNVRELKAFIERGMNIVEGNALTLDCLNFSAYTEIPEQNMQIQENESLHSLEAEVRKAEISAIQRALKESNGDRTLAAQKLKIHLASLYRKMAKYDLK